MRILKSISIIIKKYTRNNKNRKKKRKILFGKNLRTNIKKIQIMMQSLLIVESLTHKNILRHQIKKNNRNKKNPIEENEKSLVEKNQNRIMKNNKIKKTESQ